MEFRTKEYRDYDNAVEIEIKCKKLIAPEDMQTIQACIETIITTTEKYFSRPEPKKGTPVAK